MGTCAVMSSRVWRRGAERPRPTPTTAPARLLLYDVFGHLAVRPIRLGGARSLDGWVTHGGTLFGHWRGGVHRVAPRRRAARGGAARSRLRRLLDRSARQPLARS